jgi:hypothetical protein
MNRLECSLDPKKAADDTLGGEELTVGSVFHLGCKGAGDLPEGATWTLRLAPEQKYMLNLLGHTRENDRWTFEVTSYRVGDHAIEAATLLSSDGREWALGPLNLKVVSVLDPVQPPEKPYGPMGPIPVGIPVAWILGLVAIALFLTLTLGLKIARRIARRRFLDALKAREPMGGALHEVHRRLRQLQRHRVLFAGKTAPPGEALDVVRELDGLLVDYLEQRFQEPLQKRSWPEAFKRVAKKIPPARKDEAEALRKLGKELKTALVADRVEAKDAIQLTENLRQVVEALDVREKRA